MQPVAQFKVSEEGRNGLLSVFPDRIERTSHGRLRKNTGMEIIPFSRVSSVELDRGFRRQEVIIHAGGNNIRVKVYGEAVELVRLLNAGMAGQLAQAATQPTMPPPHQPTMTAPPPAMAPPQPAPMPLPPPSGPPAGWYPDPVGAPFQRWWDGTKWTEHTQP